MASASHSEEGDERRERKERERDGQEPYGNPLGGEEVDRGEDSSNVGRGLDGIKFRGGEVHDVSRGDKPSDDGCSDAPETLSMLARPAQK